MGATVRREKEGMWVLEISGKLAKDEVDAVQAAAASTPGLKGDVRLLVVISGDFSGWVAGESWNDMAFFTDYGDKIIKIAIVGDPRWKDDMMMFLCAGLRRAPVKYFEGGELAAAREWLV